jgi:hypothetical protein
MTVTIFSFLPAGELLDVIPQHRQNLSFIVQSISVEIMNPGK